MQRTRINRIPRHEGTEWETKPPSCLIAPRAVQTKATRSLTSSLRRGTAGLAGLSCRRPNRPRGHSLALPPQNAPRAAQRVRRPLERSAIPRLELEEALRSLGSAGSKHPGLPQMTGAAHGAPAGAPAGGCAPAAASGGRQRWKLGGRRLECATDIITSTLHSVKRREASKDRAVRRVEIGRSAASAPVFPASDAAVLSWPPAAGP